MDETPKAESSKPAGISRREFARRAALASAVASMAPTAALANPSSPLAAPVAGKITPSAQQPVNLPKLSPESQAEVDTRIEAILVQYGKRFSDDQKADLHRLCAVAQPPLDRLRAYNLENGDAPALYLKPLVEREKNPLENTRVGKTPQAPGKP